MRRRQLAMALYAVAAARLALWLLPWRIAEPRLRRLRLWGPPRGSAAELASAVHRAAGWVPRASCLVQALALRRLLAGAGQASALHIGVRGGAGGFRAHAWVEAGGLAEPDEARDYARLLTLPS